MVDALLTLPPGMVSFLNGANGERWRGRLAPPGGAAHIGADPEGARLGSGGGTVNLLHQVWQESGGDIDLSTWLEERSRLVLHSGGESRRLPAYAGIGKAFLPVPVLPSLSHQRFDQILCDFQIPSYSRVLKEAGGQSSVMIASGDVWLDFDPLSIPAVGADIVGIGMRVSPEVASHFGVYFVARKGRRGTDEREVAFFLQKPEPATIQGHLIDHEFFVDTGMWLLSAKAVSFLFRVCGWDEESGTFATENGLPGYLDLYTRIGNALGRLGTQDQELVDAGLNELKRSVIPLDDARFYHLGSNSQILSFLEQIQGHGEQRVERFLVATPQSVLSEESAPPVLADTCVSATELVAGGHNLLTGLPEGHSIHEVPQRVCVDVSPVADDMWCLRVYHLADSLRGTMDEGTICGMEATTWLAGHGVETTAADVFELAIYPTVSAAELTQELLDWFVSDEPTENLLAGRKCLSARQIPDALNLDRLFAAKMAGYGQVCESQWRALAKEGQDVSLRQDNTALAQLLREAGPEYAERLLDSADKLRPRIVRPVQQARFEVLLGEIAGSENCEMYRQRGFKTLRETMVASNEVQLVVPLLALKQDQIVWARSPVRLDLAGGWTDTPPYCLEFGGAVVNVATILNGQPPIQVIARVLKERELRIRSIDLGSEETIRTYAELDTFSDPRASFSLAKATLAISGFLPRFYAGSPYKDLESQLQDFGGGLELSLLSAVPKGSGLGTSSILAATLLGALNRACQLELDEVDLYNRVLAVEQLLTTGGGWQDQAGALYRGVKLIETSPGPSQDPTVRFLPEHLFGPDQVNHRWLLYYTGITRLAKGILQQIVTNMFLAESGTLRTLAMIRQNAQQVYHAVLTGNEEGMIRAIARSWELNKQLDPDTTNEEIEGIIALCGDDLVACKLLGAGGGGFMLMCAHDAEAGRRIRKRLEQNPPNSLARFVSFEVAASGLQVTVS